MSHGDGAETELHSKSIVAIGPGDSVVFQTCGGGGYGDAFEREPERVLRDVAEGWVSVERARADYGVAIELDEHDEPRLRCEETERLRGERGCRDR